MGKTAFIFPGQGSQAVGMGRDFHESSPRARAVFEAADRVLDTPLSRMCFEGPGEQLERTDVQQPAIFVTSVAIWEALLEEGLPGAVLQAAAGLSLGEYTALHVAGAIGFDDALRLVARRGRFMQEAAEAAASGMVSLIGADEDIARRLCEQAAGGQVLAPANYNCPGQIVLSGAAEACERAVNLAPEVGCRAVPLKVAGAFHSPFMETAGRKLGQALADTAVAGTAVPVIANVNAEPHRDPESIRAWLQQQVTHPVRWCSSIEALIADGFDRFVEVGPGRVLTGLMRKINRKITAVNISTVETARAELAALSAA